MTKDHRILSLQISAAEMNAIEDEAQAAPFLGNKSDYMRSLIQGRHEMQIVASPQAQTLMDQHQQQIEQLQQDHQAELAQLREEAKWQMNQLQAELDQSEQALLTGQQTLSEQQQAYRTLQNDYAQLERKYTDCDVEHQISKATQEFRSDAGARDLATARQQTAEWKSKHQTAKQEINDLKQQLGQAKQKSSMLEVAKGLVEKNPTMFDKLVDTWLGGKASGLGATPASYETRLGQAMRHDFPGEQLPLVIDLLQYLRDNPVVRQDLLDKPEFIAYQVQLRATTSPGQAKATAQSAKKS